MRNNKISQLRPPHACEKTQKSKVRAEISVALGLVKQLMPYFGSGNDIVSPSRHNFLELVELEEEKLLKQVTYRCCVDICSTINIPSVRFSLKKKPTTCFLLKI